MNKKSAVFIVLIIVLFLVGWGIFKNMNIPNKTQGQIVDSLPSNVVTISITSDGFVPHEVVIGKNQSIAFVNDDTVNHWPASDLHPTHELYPEFDPLKPVKPGEIWLFEFEKTGGWAMHDHLFPHRRGEITVE
jgi:hypothetical protein